MEKRRIKTLRGIALTLLVCFATIPLSGQVTIGALTDPQSFSLLELVSDNSKGLRLPQIQTTAQRDAIAASFKDNLAYGLLIFNMETNCMEYWSGTGWESLCSGSAHITLTGDPCTYDPAALAPSDGTQPDCVYTPKDDPDCVVPSGQAYQVFLMAGSAYATLKVDEITSAFSITFNPNNSAGKRIAVVRVVNNCSGEYQDFVFAQAGEACPTPADAFTLQSNTTKICGSSGAAVVFVENPQTGMNYVWEYGGVIVNTGNYMEITRPGKYTVYAGLLGCTFATPQVVTITQDNSSTGYGAPVLTATNGGILCGGGNVVLTAYNVTESVLWYHNGALYSTTTAPTNTLTVNADPSLAGEWFAVQQTGTCGSRISNKITLIDETSTGTALTAPIATANGTDLSGGGTITACKSGTLALEVTNATDYPAGTIYEWFDNGVSISRGTAPAVIYTIPPNKTSVTLSVQVSNYSGGCPNTTVSSSIPISVNAPAATTINNGASTAAICGSTAATLRASNSSSSNYEWLKDGVVITSANTSSYPANQPGSYTVRFQDAGGCWSPLSTAITVVQSAAISLSWQVEPDGTGIIANQESFTVFASPAPDKYTWTSSDPAVATVTPIDGGKTVSISYLTAGTTDIAVTAENTCGAVTLQKTITVSDGCTPITSVTITPSGTVTKALNVSGAPKTPGDDHTTFTATATNGSPATSYQWYVDGGVQTESSSTFIYNTPTGAGTHTIYAIPVNDCQPTNPAKSASVTVNVTKDNQPDASGNYLLSGKVCFDVKRNNDGGVCSPLSSRTDDFASTKTFSYVFTATNGSTSYSNLTFELVDNNNLAVNKSTAGNVLTITFRDDINTVAKGRDKTTALILTIVAKYKDNTGADKQISLDVAVQDCTCGCTVKTASGGFITFLCYNLGASDAVKLMTPMQQAKTPSSTNSGTDSNVYGDLYQWGRRADGHEKRNSPVYNLAGSYPFTYDLNSQIPQNYTLYYGKFITVYGGNGDWHGNSDSYKNDNLWNFSVYPANNPCPPGWRIPTSAEWASVINGGVPGVAGSSATFTTAASQAGQTLQSGNFWKWNPASNGTAGWLVSPDGGANYTLFLPAGGERAYNNGVTGSIGLWGMYYNTSPGGSTSMSATQMNPGSTYNKANGHSIRCVQE